MLWSRYNATLKPGTKKEMVERDITFNKHGIEGEKNVAFEIANQKKHCKGTKWETWDKDKACFILNALNKKHWFQYRLYRIVEHLWASYEERIGMEY